jgi:hypothetical protein
VTVISVVIFCVLVAMMVILFVHSLIELDNPMVVPQVMTAVITAVLAFTLAAMIANGQVADITPMINQTDSVTISTSSTAINKLLKTISQTTTYHDHHTIWTDPSISLILTLVGVCASILAIGVTVLSVLRIFLDGDEEET